MPDVPALGGEGTCPECGGKTTWVAVPKWDIKAESCKLCDYTYKTRISTGEEFIPQD